MIKTIKYISVGIGIIFVAIILLVAIYSVLTEQPIPTFFIQATKWIAIIGFIFWLISKFFKRKKDDRS